MNFSIPNPSRRQCIRGINCQRSCCTKMVRYGAKTEKKPTSPQAIPGPGGDSNLTFSESDDTDLSSSDLDNGEDVPDGCVIPRHNLEKSSSLNIVHRGKSHTPIRSNSEDDLDARKKRSSLPGKIDSRGANKAKDNLSPNSQYSSIYSPISPPKRKSHETAFHAQEKYSTYSLNSLIINKVWLLIIPITLVISYFYPATAPLTNYNDYYEHDFKLELEQIGGEYNIGSDALLQIQTGIKSTSERNDTTSIIFLYRSMDEFYVKKFVNKVANAAAKYLRNDTTSMSITVKTSDLDMATYKELMDKYKADLDDSGAILFQDLHDIPLNLAMAFHYYCDEYDPLVRKTAVFFTLNLARCGEYVVKHKQEHKVVEHCLSDKWRTIKKDKLMPLLARVINIVVDLDGGHK